MHSLPLNLMMAAILNSANLHSAILVFPLKLTYTCQDWLPPFAQKKLHSLIVTQLVCSSDLEFCHLGFRHCHLVFRHLVIFSQIHSKTTYSTLTLTQANSIWLTWWGQPSWILPSWIQQFCTKLWLKLIHFHLNWWWQPSLILPYWMYPFCTKKDFTNSFSLKPDYGSQIELCHLGYSHLSFSFQTSLTLAKIGFHHLHKKKLHSLILTQLEDGSHLEFHHLEFGHLGFSHL